MSVSRRVLEDRRQSVQHSAGGSLSLLGILLSIPGRLRSRLGFSLGGSSFIKFTLCNCEGRLAFEGRMKVWTVTPLGTVAKSMEFARWPLRNPLAKSSFLTLLVPSFHWLPLRGYINKLINCKCRNLENATKQQLKVVTWKNHIKYVFSLSRSKVCSLLLCHSFRGSSIHQKTHNANANIPYLPVAHTHTIDVYRKYHANRNVT